MSFLMYVIAFFLVVAVTMILPGVKHVVTPIWAAVGHGVVAFVGWSWRWVVFLVKVTLSAHFEVIRHMVLSKKEMEMYQETKERK